MAGTAVIWDLDGTLLDSYPMIVASLREALEENGICLEKEEILEYVIRFSVADFLRKVAEEARCPVKQLADEYSERCCLGNDTIQPMHNALPVLERTAGMGVSHFVFTHKGATANAVLERLGMRRFFAEIVTSASGFPRKPSPDAVNYLVEKYGLDRETTFYVGDRRLDVECAENAGIKSILFLPTGGCGRATGKENHCVGDLLEIADILKQVHRYKTTKW